MADKKYHKIELRVSQFEYKIFKDLKSNHGLSARDIISAITQNCKPEIITVYNKQEKEVQIKKSLLFNKK